jgi:hypothetical protein
MHFAILLCVRLFFQVFFFSPASFLQGINRGLICLDGQAAIDALR